MITARDLQPLVENETFRQLLKRSEAEPGSRAHRVLKGLERLARGVTRDDDQHEAWRRRKQDSQAPGQAPRRSLKEIGDGRSEHLSV